MADALLPVGNRPLVRCRDCVYITKDVRGITPTDIESGVLFCDVNRQYRSVKTQRHCDYFLARAGSADESTR
jgi:hypothetical protein